VVSIKGLSISIGIGELIATLIAFGIFILIFRIIAGDIIKLQLEKEEYVESGKVVNLANQIINSEIASYDENNQPKKGVLSIKKLNEYNNKNKPLDCCDYIDYDYSIKIVGNEIYNIGYNFNHLNELTNLGKRCKAISEIKILKNYKFPLVIEGNEKESASMSLALAQTPASMISSEVAVSCQRNTYENVISVFGFNKDSLKISKTEDYYNICLTTFKGYEMCKKIECKKTIKLKVITKCVDGDGKCPNNCGYVLDKDCKTNTCSIAKIKSSGDEVLLCLAGEEKELDQC
jgi:hypothetical protein